MGRKLSIDFYIGLLASIMGIVLYILLITSTNETDVMMVNLFWEVLPALLSIISLYTKRPFLMALAFIINLPIGLYLLMLNNYFVIFGMLPFLYLSSFIIMIIKKRGR